jgi:hypothetical protein
MSRKNTNIRNNCILQSLQIKLVWNIKHKHVIKYVM